MKNFQMVPGAGIEPARLAAGDFESPASTNFTTRAGRAKLGIIAHLKTLLPPPQLLAAGQPECAGPGRRPRWPPSLQRRPQDFETMSETASHSASETLG